MPDQLHRPSPLYLKQALVQPPERHRDFAAGAAWWLAAVLVGLLAAALWGMP